MPIVLSQPKADVFVAETGESTETALARVTHLCIAAHQDDIEIMAYSGIVDCLEIPGKYFGGVVVTDGGGSPRAGPYSKFNDEQMKEVRREEQRVAAKLGNYAVQLQLAHTSSAVKDGSRKEVRADLFQILTACRAEILYLHNPADKHDSHVATLLRCIEALRELSPAQRPGQVLGCAVWRDLDWLVEGDRLALDSGRRPGLAAELIRVFDSQISGGKRYDLATVGRRLAHATFDTPHAVDRIHGITWAMDLSSLVTDPTKDVADYTLSFVDRLREDIKARIAKFR